MKKTETIFTCDLCGTEQRYQDGEPRVAPDLWVSMSTQVVEKDAAPAPATAPVCVVCARHIYHEYQRRRYIPAASTSVGGSQHQRLPSAPGASAPSLRT